MKFSEELRRMQTPVHAESADDTEALLEGIFTACRNAAQMGNAFCIYQLNGGDPDEALVLSRRLSELLQTEEYGFSTVETLRVPSASGDTAVYVFLSWSEEGTRRIRAEQKRMDKELHPGKGCMTVFLWVAAAWLGLNLLDILAALLK